jgi:2-polyprenyl-6-methoxyphenol hydroxylase-like FAD-dependent oxidoreductase
MRKYEQTEVLVAGAGPVGMLAALTLAEQGVEVMVVDHEWRRASRSYACGLHPRTLAMLAELGLADGLLKLGRRIESLAFYERATRVGELKFSHLAGPYPFLLLVPQSEFEGLLEQRLVAHPKVKLLWNHRLASLIQEDTEVLTTIDRLAESATGYIVPTWDWVVKQTFQNHANYLIGADGHHSHIRRVLGLEWEAGLAPEAYEVFEFECESDAGHEAAVVLDEAGISVMWPLGERRCRWAFQRAAPSEEDFPLKTRDLVQVVHQGDADDEVQRLNQLIGQHAPFYKNRPLEVDWSGHIRFEHRAARQFGLNRCWLAGDAGHQTGPVGMQSLNAGLFEARDLAGRLANIVFSQASPETLKEYDLERRAEWRGLLGMAGGLQPGAAAEPWVKRHAARLLACLPGTGEELRHLAAQIGLVFKG